MLKVVHHIISHHYRKVMFLHLSVILFTRWGCAIPPWADTPCAVHAGILSTSGGTHPTGMQSCLCYYWAYLVQNDVGGSCTVYCNNFHSFNRRWMSMSICIGARLFKVWSILRFFPSVKVELIQIWSFICMGLKTHSLYWGMGIGKMHCSPSRLVRHRENREFGCSFFADRESTGNLPKAIKKCYYTGISLPTRKFWKFQKWKDLPGVMVGCCHSLLAFVANLRWRTSQ